MVANLHGSSRKVYPRGDDVRIGPKDALELVGAASAVQVGNWQVRYGFA